MKREPTREESLAAHRIQIGVTRGSLEAFNDTHLRCHTAISSAPLEKNASTVSGLAETPDDQMPKEVLFNNTGQHEMHSARSAWRTSGIERSGSFRKSIAKDSTRAGQQPRKTATGKRFRHSGISVGVAATQTKLGYSASPPLKKRERS